MHDHAARTGAAVIIERGNFVITGVRIPAKKLIWSGLANEFLAGKPINFLHVAVHFRAQRNRFSRRQDDFFTRRRNDSRTVSGSPGQFASSFWQKRRRSFSRNAGLLEESQEFARPKFINFA